MLSTLKHIQSRRADLTQHIDVEKSFELWEESCVPSYCHSNWMAAYVSWQRLFRCVALAKRNRPNPTRVLDFGSSVGELGQILREQQSAEYHFIEQDENAAKYLKSRLPQAHHTTLADAADGSYDWVFAIDSLEHNENVTELLEQLATKLSPQGIFVLSGPTENRLYQLGRRIAGFSGAYHTTNIYDIESKACRLFRRVDGATIFPGLNFFSLTVWTHA
ncbi:MAG: methyltransferase domain-containing protein [Planctomycetales bacterium]|nr:methyltransferase domain-containing protein [Planctomycetales bacterium]MCA9169314.1 methyltransferase domain-containing protein [Planctomycetales bacterium]